MGRILLCWSMMCFPGQVALPRLVTSFYPIILSSVGRKRKCGFMPFPRELT